MPSYSKIPKKPEDILALLDQIVAGDAHNAAEWTMNDPGAADMNALRTNLSAAIQERDTKAAEWRASVQALREKVSLSTPAIRRAIERIRAHWGRSSARVLDYGISVTGPGAPSGLPIAPAAITATGAGSGKIRIDWSTVSKAKFYEIWRADEDPQKPGQLDWRLIQTLTKTIFTNTGLTSGRRYHYKVRAGNAAGIGEFSAEANCVAP